MWPQRILSKMESGLAPARGTLIIPEQFFIVTISQLL